MGEQPNNSVMPPLGIKGLGLSQVYIYMPLPNGSHLALRRYTLAIVGLVWESIATSVCLIAGVSPVVVTKNSPHLMKPKNPRQHDAQRSAPVYGSLWEASFCCSLNMMCSVMGSLLCSGASSALLRLIPLNTYWRRGHDSC